MTVCTNIKTISMIPQILLFAFFFALFCVEWSWYEDKIHSSIVISSTYLDKWPFIEYVWPWINRYVKQKIFTKSNFRYNKSKLLDYDQLTLRYLCYYNIVFDVIIPFKCYYVQIIICWHHYFYFWNGGMTVIFSNMPNIRCIS